jgi:hypothetical protein
VTLLDAVRRRMRQPAGAADSRQAGSHELTDRYARLGERDAVGGLARFNQSELAAIETFERSHRERPAVLKKLRYMRHRRPAR